MQKSADNYDATEANPIKGANCFFVAGTHLDVVSFLISKIILFSVLSVTPF